MRIYMQPHVQYEEQTNNGGREKAVICLSDCVRTIVSHVVEAALKYVVIATAVRCITHTPEQGL